MEEDLREGDVERMLRDYYRSEAVGLHAPKDLWERVSGGLDKARKSLLRRWLSGRELRFLRMRFWGEVLERGMVLGMLTLFAFLALATFFFMRSQSRLREPEVIPAVAPTLVVEPTPTPTLTPQPTPTPTPTSAVLESFEVVRVERWRRKVY